MNQSRSRLVDLAGLLSNVTALHTLFSIFAFRQTGRSDPAGLLIWCVCLSLTCGGLALFLRRPRTQRSVLLLALTALALQGAVVWLWGVRYPSLLSWLCLLAMWGFSYFRCYELLIRPTPAEQLMVSFETASLVLLAAALCTAAGVLPLDTALAPAAGTLLALAALAGQRASNSRPGGQAAGSLRGRLLLLLLLAALGGGAALCVLLFTGTAAQALTALTGWLRELAFGALALLDRFFRWLFSLFPAPAARPARPSRAAMRSSMCWPAWSCWPASARSFGPSAGAEAAPGPTLRSAGAASWTAAAHGTPWQCCGPGWRTASASSSPTWPGGIPPPACWCGWTAA